MNLHKVLLCAVVVGLILCGCAVQSQPQSQSATDPVSLPPPASQPQEQSDELGAGVIANLIADPALEFNFAGMDGHLRGGERELQTLLTLLDELKLRDITTLIATQQPLDFKGDFTLSKQDATTLIYMLKGLRPTTFDQIPNPATGGSWTVYIETAAAKFSVGGNGNWLVVAIDGQDKWWVFDATHIQAQDYEISNFLWEKFMELSGRQI